MPCLRISLCARLYLLLIAYCLEAMFKMKGRGWSHESKKQYALQT